MSLVPSLGVSELMQTESEATLDLQILLSQLIEGSSKNLLELAFYNISHLVMFELLAAGCLETEIARALYFRLDKLRFAETFTGFKTQNINLINSYLDGFVGFQNYWIISEETVRDYYLESFYLWENFTILYRYDLINLFSHNQLNQQSFQDFLIFFIFSNRYLLPIQLCYPSHHLSHAIHSLFQGRDQI